MFKKCLALLSVISLFTGITTHAANITGNQKYAEDPSGDVVNVAATNATGTPVGLTVSNTQITGKIWTQNFGWIEMQPTNGGVVVTVQEENGSSVGRLSGNAWGKQVGWITFGQWGEDPNSGVYIDNEGYFQGVAFSQQVGEFAFGDYMLLNADANVYTDNVNNKPTFWARTDWRPVLEGGNAPEASFLNIFGLPMVGDTLHGYYGYHDADGDQEEGSTYRWLRADSAGGTYVPIAGATGQTYTLTAADNGKFIKFEVTPSSDSLIPETGATKTSPPTGPCLGFDFEFDISSFGDDDYMMDYQVEADVQVTYAYEGGSTTYTTRPGQRIKHPVTPEECAANSTCQKERTDTCATCSGKTYDQILDEIYALFTPPSSGSHIMEVGFESGVAGSPLVLKTTDGPALEIPDGATVFADVNWDRTIAPPEIVTLDSIEGFDVNGAIAVGVPGETLVFDVPVKISIPSATGTPFFSIDGIGYQEITTECDDPENPTNIVFPRECFYRAGNNTVIWTYHLTNFGDATPNNTANANLAVTVNEGALGIDMVDDEGTTVLNPNIPMDAIVSRFMNQESTGTLGVPMEQIIVYNPTSDPTWTATIGATGDPASVSWTGTTYTMDYNDPDMSISGNGQLNIDPTTGVYANVVLDHITGLVDQTTASPAGISLGDSAAFADVISSIDLFSSTSADPYRIYTLQGVSLTQVVPARQPADDYVINLTLTIA